MRNSPIKVITAFSNQFLQNYCINNLLYNFPYNFEVIGRTDQGQEVITLTHRNEPDLILIDIILNDMGGIELVEKILNEYPKLNIVIISNYSYKTLEAKAAQLGVKGFYNLNSSSEELYTLLSRIFNGNFNYSGQQSELERKSNQYIQITGTESQYIHSVLTKQQLKIFQLFGNRFTKKEIKDKLNIYIKTLENHINHIKRKLQIHSTAEMICIASKYVLLTYNFKNR